MTTLTTAPVAPLLDLLFAMNDASSPTSDPALSNYWNTLGAQERKDLMQSRTDYADFYARMKNLPLAVSRETGNLLYMLARATGARNIVEFGTSFGLSTLCLASALRDNGGGLLITSEFESSKVARARQHLADGGLSDLVDFREGDALETLARDLPASVDLLLLDGAKGLYSDILALVAPHLRPGALILADNADYCPAYLEQVRGGKGYLSLPFSDEVELSIHLG
jgi:predicted O-methyltransferase YrrM